MLNYEIVDGSHLYRGNSDKQSCPLVCSSIFLGLYLIWVTLVVIFLITTWDHSITMLIIEIHFATEGVLMIYMTIILILMFTSDYNNFVKLKPFLNVGTLIYYVLIVSIGTYKIVYVIVEHFKHNGKVVWGFYILYFYIPTIIDVILFSAMIICAYNLYPAQKRAIYFYQPVTQPQQPLYPTQLQNFSLKVLQ